MMSRSIKQYKEAMDSIRISESFAGRTETLLKESGSMESVSLPRGNGAGIRKISFAACAGLAACIAAVFILRHPPAEIQNIESGSADIAAVTSVTDVTAAGEETVYVAIEDDKDEYIREGDRAVEILENDEYYENETGAPAEPETSDENIIIVPVEEKAPDTTRVSEALTPPAKTESAESSVTNSYIAGDSDRHRDDGSFPEDTASGQGPYDDNDDVCEDDSAGEGSVPSDGHGAAKPQPALGSGSGLYYINYSEVTAELVSCAGGTDSAALQLDEENTRYIVSMTAFAVHAAPEDVSGAEGTSYKYILTVSGKTNGKTMYVISIAEDKITVTDRTGETAAKKTYIPDKTDLSEIESSIELIISGADGR